MPWVAPLVAAVVAVSCLYPRFLGNRTGLALMLPVLGYTLWQYIDWQFPPVASQIGAMTGGLGIGLVLFGVGLPISSREPKRVLTDSLRGLRLTASRATHLRTLAHQAVFIAYEELIWRVFLTHALSPSLPAWAVILIAALLFWLAHTENRPIGGHSLEFLLFALALGTIYILSGSFLAVWVVHAVRNLLILASWWHADSQRRASVLPEGR